MFEALPQIPPRSRWRQQTLPAPIVVSIIRRPGFRATSQSEASFLLIRRAGEPYRGRWALVGGKWEFGETMAAAAVREVREETGLDGEFVALRGIVSERLAPAESEGSGAAHFLLFVCQVDVQDGEAREQQEGAVAWFSTGQIEELHLKQAIIASDYVMLQRFAGAARIRHYEADMVGGPVAGGDGSESERLARFEEAG
jgi:ADP-ribose pyrophosphatase YjhB (NUDIX family)